MLCQEGPEKVHFSFWQKTLVSILRVFLKWKNKTNYISMAKEKTATCLTFITLDSYRFHTKTRWPLERVLKVLQI